MSTSLFTTAVIDDKVTIYPSEYSNLNETLLLKIRKKLEGYCTQFGYIKEVMSIVDIEDNPRVCDTSGVGECIFHIKVRVNRGLPEKNQLIDCVVTTDDEHMGANVSFDHPIFISILNSTNHKMKIGDKVQVNVEDFQLKHGDTIVNIVSTYVQHVKT